MSHHWEGILDTSPGPPTPVWLSRPDDPPKSSKKFSSVDTSWKPLTPTDCHALNHATGPSVIVQGGRATAREGLLVPNFGNATTNPPRQLDYATWFAKIDRSVEDDDSTPLIPVLDKRDAQVIEDLYQQAAQVAQLDVWCQHHATGVVLPSDPQYKVQVVPSSRKRVQGKTVVTYALRKVPLQWMSLSPRYTLQRGYGPYDGPPDWDGQLGPVRHLVFGIHGIGEALWSRAGSSQLPSLTQSMDQMRKSVQELQWNEWTEQQAKHKHNNNHQNHSNNNASRIPSPPDRIEFIPIEWYDQLHNQNSAMMQTLRATTLPTIPALRTIANDVILDVLLYLTPNFCHETLQSVTRQIKEHYARFLEIHPEFEQNGGTVSLMGHSLGSVIVWDLLALLKEHSEQQQQLYNHDLQNDNDSTAIPSATAPVHTTGTWGPSLPPTAERDALVLPFRPHASILLGSPIGLFLTLRGAHPVLDQLRRGQQQQNTQKPTQAQNQNQKIISPFTLPTRYLFNIFHPSDPVSYRVEPLLLPTDFAPEALPSPPYLTARGKDVRLHIKARQFSETIKKQVNDQTAVWQGVLSSVLQAVSDEPESANNNNEAVEQQAEAPRALTEPIVFPLGGDSPRVDFSLQPNLIDSEYLSAVLAHTVYFSHGDIHQWLAALLHNEEALVSKV